jgi:hypothetical protein
MHFDSEQVLVSQAYSRILFLPKWTDHLLNCLPNAPIVLVCAAQVSNVPTTVMTNVDAAMILKVPQPDCQPVRGPVRIAIDGRSYWKEFGVEVKSRLIIQSKNGSV